MLRVVFAVLIAVVAALPFSAALAQDPQPGEVILQVTGAIKTPDGATTAEFDMAKLAAMGETTISTSTVWTEGVHTYTGVPLKTFVDAMGITGTTMNMFAVNDYMIEVPVSDAVENGPILAYEMDGKPMSVRDKGPIWLIYPFDSNKDYQSDVIYSRSIWQLDRIEVKG